MMRMPSRSAKSCLKPGCRTLVRGASRCPEHIREQEQARGTATQRGYDSDWRKLRAAHIASHPTCSQPGCTLPATDVDHVIAHRGNDALRLDPGNLQSFCHGHHSQKTVSEDGGLGRARETVSVGHIWPALLRCADKPVRVVIDPVGILAPQSITYVDWSSVLAAQDEEPSV